VSSDADRAHAGASFEDLQRLDIRVGRVLDAEPLAGARRPAIRMRIDFGAEIGHKHSSAQITELYDPGSLVGRLVLGVVNLPPKRIAGFISEALVLGVYASDGPVVLIRPDDEFVDPRARVRPGDRLG